MKRHIEVENNEETRTKVLKTTEHDQFNFQQELLKAELGDLNSQLQVAEYYRNGLSDDIGKIDYSKALFWFQKAAQQGSEIAQTEIGILLMNGGNGIYKDIEQSYVWLSKAAENGYSKAKFYIGLLFEEASDYSKAAEWYSKVIEEESEEDFISQAQFNLGRIYCRGRGVEKNVSKGFELILKAAKREYTLAQLFVSGMFANGLGTERNIIESLYWSACALNTNCSMTFIENINEDYTIDFFKEKCENEQCNSLEECLDESEYVIVRFSDRDFKLLSNYLKNSKYLSTMISKNWIDSHKRENNCLILDLQSIENEIFIDEIKTSQIFEQYVKYLEEEKISSDCQTKLKLFELSRYLEDGGCIFQIVKESHFLLRVYFWSLFMDEMKSEDLTWELPYLTCFIMESNSQRLRDEIFEGSILLPSIIQHLISLDIHKDAKLKLASILSTDLKFESNHVLDNQHVYVSFSGFNQVQSVVIYAKLIELQLVESDPIPNFINSNRFEIISSEPILKEESQVFICLTTKSGECAGVFLNNFSDWEETINVIFKMEADFSLIQILIIP